MRNLHVSGFDSRENKAAKLEAWNKYLSKLHVFRRYWGLRHRSSMKDKVYEILRNTIHELRRLSIDHRTVGSGFASSRIRDSMEHSIAIGIYQHVQRRYRNFVVTLSSNAVIVRKQKRSKYCIIINVVNRDGSDIIIYHQTIKAHGAITVSYTNPAMFELIEASIAKLDG